ncbi:MAG: glycerophosphodiester phosphodiesterase family protein [Firmicutes bacterium]|nr:glycerophosphodiester phosphodiesterase family protein [Bacillota bacterium]
MKTNVREKLLQLSKKKEILIAVHRGSSTGNIAENTIASTICAVKMGGDIVELDIVKSTDGVFYGFHTKMELRLFGREFDLETMSSSEIDNLEFINTNMKPTGYKVERIADILNTFKGKTLFNLDRCWLYLDELLPFLDEFNMYDQLIIKSPPDNKYLDLFADYDDKILYMPVVRNMEQVERVLEHKIKPAAIELIFTGLDNQIINEHTISRLKAENMLLWANAIIVGPKNVIAGSLTDDVSIIEGYDKGWGKLMDMGFDIIQTDWPALLKKYRKKRKKGVIA